MKLKSPSSLGYVPGLVRVCRTLRFSDGTSDTVTWHPPPGGTTPEWKSRA
ncbi:hypothetical protein STRTUCAR8_10103 [Streptomyces turgidiscabies Car8]|uniref:Uncharacterized protein n=1 Tax=Streptomyces turgidiscabies (strain Car8) TaxID=698760 RepID=L7FHK0_STRT8|nr:hypothetical protein STRTUCAR8_10103 [Streptomyces turgidiscabies Car8]